MKRTNTQKELPGVETLKKKKKKTFKKYPSATLRHSPISSPLFAYQFSKFIKIVSSQFLYFEKIAETFVEHSTLSYLSITFDFDFSDEKL